LKTNLQCQLLLTNNFLFFRPFWALLEGEDILIFKIIIYKVSVT
jgi:hypothetical protein